MSTNYIVLSYAYENDSSVTIHCLVRDREQAVSLYTKIASSPRLVELIQVPDNWTSEKGSTFFWGNPTEGVTVVASTNK
jgi:hypothetical protein